jgi:hypothetical protein
MSRYILVPVDDGDCISLSIPQGLVCNEMFEDLKNKVMNKKKLKTLIQELASNLISESEDGCITRKDKKISNVKLRDALIDTCNSEFFEKYESFYKILRDLGITF